MENIRRALQRVLCEEVSLHFSCCRRDTLEQSIEYFWEDIEEACFNRDEQSGTAISPCTLVWIPKSFSGSPVVPTLARASWEHVDASVELLLIRILRFDARVKGEDIHSTLRDCIRTTTISCCESQSFVKDRIPLEHSEAIWFSKKCVTPMFESMNKIMKFIIKGDEEYDMSFGALQGDLLNSVTLCMNEIDQMPLCSDNAAKLPMTSLFGNVIERFMYLSDCIDVCRWAAWMAKQRDLDETDGLHHGTFEQTQIQLEALFVRTSNLLSLFGGFCQASEHISTENVDEWGASWRKCLEDGASIMTLYSPFVSMEILGMVLSSFSYMITKPLALLLPEYGDMMRHSSGMEDYLDQTAHAMRQLHSLQEVMQDLFIRGQGREEEEESLLQGSMSLIHFMQFRTQAIRDILKYKQKYFAFFEHFRKSVDGMGDTLDEFAEILRQATQHAGHVLDNECVVDVDMHLQETIMLLHRVTLKALKNIEDHILSLSSRKRAEFIASGCMLEDSDMHIRKILQNIRETISRKAEDEFDIVNSVVENCHQIMFQIKGLPRYAGALTWMGFLHERVVDLDSHASVESKETRQKCRDTIRTQVEEWLQTSLERFQNNLRFLQTSILSVQQDSVAVQFHKGLWRGLIELFFLLKMGLLEHEDWLMDISKIYYDAMATFHRLRYLAHRSTKLVDEIHAYFPPIALEAKSQIFTIVQTGSQSVSWMSASLVDFMQRFELQVGRMKSINEMLHENHLSLASLRDGMDRSLQFRHLMSQNDGCALDLAIDLVIGIMKDSLSIHYPASDEILQSCAKKFADVVWSPDSQFSESVIDAYQQHLRAQVASIFLNSLTRFVEMYVEYIFEPSQSGSVDILEKDWRIILKTVGSEDRGPEQIFQNINLALKSMIQNTMEILQGVVSTRELDLTRQKFESSINDRTNRAEMNSRTSRCSSSLPPGIATFSMPNSDVDHGAHKEDSLIQIDHKTSFAMLDEILAPDQSSTMTKDTAISIAVTKRLHVVQSTSTLPNQDIGTSKSREELHDRIKSLEMLLSRSKNDGSSLSQSIEELLGCPTERLCLHEGFHHLISDLREQLWSLELSTEHLRQEILGIERTGLGVQHLSSGLDVLIQNSKAISKSIGVLQGRIITSEDEILKKIESLRKELNEIQNDVRWLFEVQKMSEVDILSTTGIGDLDDMRAKVMKGTEIMENLECLSRLFKFPQNSAEQIQNAPHLLDNLIEIIDPMRKWKEKVLEIKASSWYQYKKSIAYDLESISSDEQQIKNLATAVGHWTIYQEYNSFIQSISATLHLLFSIMSNSLEGRHWAKLGGILDQEISSEHLTVSQIWTENVLDKRAQIEDLTSLVSRESTMRARLDSIKEQWQLAEVEFVEYKNKGSIFLNPSGTSDMMEKLEDSLMALSSMSTNRASLHFRDEIKSLIKLLSNFEESMQLWLSTQSVWAYMEAVFEEGDIACQLPEEAARFSRINSTYLRLIHDSSNNLLIMYLFDGDGMREQFVTLLSELEVCQNSLSAYLETKRKAFPRFYFVSDSTLLEILSKGSDPREVQKHFQSGIFEGVDRVKFESDDSNTITHIVSKEGEEVQLIRNVDVAGPAEEWLADLVNAMKETLRSEARRAAKEVNKQPIQEFLFKRPAQMALLGLQVKWTADVQQALIQASMGRKGTVKKLLTTYESILSDLVNLTMSTDLSKRDRTSLETCITVFIHQKDTIEELHHKRVSDPKSFDWLKHARFRWREDKNTLIVYICDNEFEYGYEYLGVRERLVMTPLTDVCYVSLTQAIGLNFGGAPAGPAGTGKTETTKDLGATLGRYVVVFNCSDQMDHHMMGRIFKGLAQAGFWGCFDEFNRINLDVLSVCAQQLNCIMTALKERRRTFTFTDGDTVPLNPDVGYFITMNPGYAGRQELPENLKALFRGVTMMAPDRRIIMKVKLAAAGFQESDNLSTKFDMLYKLCEQQLTKQPHYDFGLRNILSVLRSAGSAKRANPHMTETTLIMKTLHDMNVSKFVPEDVETFCGLLHDVFPVNEENAHSGTKFLETLQSICRDEGKIPHGRWVDKCVQLYETSLVRHGIMVVGPPRTGKSSAIDMVAKTLTALGSKTSIWRMNPKAITSPQMFGKLDQSTGDWTDGIFSALWKKASSASHSVWIVLDGPIDAVWIENLNTVLDDNKLLTLANGDRIRMLSSMRLIFEVENLKNASPATVSRAGVIYMSPTVLGWEPILQSYINNSELPLNKTKSLIDMVVHSAITNLQLCYVEPDVGLTNLVEAFVTYLRGYSVTSQKFQEAVHQYDKEVHGQSVLVNVFLFCAIWGIGGVLDGEGKIKFSQNLKSEWDHLEFLPQGEPVHDYFYDVESERWIKWQDQVHELDPLELPRSSDDKIDILKATVPTAQSIRCKVLFDLILCAGRTPHIMGPRSCGKTTVIQQYCKTDGSHNTPATFITFSALTSPQICQNSLESLLERRQGRTYGPIGGKPSVFVLDDLSMPDTNNWGDQPTNELVRQLLELGGFYRLEKPVGEFKIVTDVTYITSSPVEGGLKLPNRLSGKLCSIYLHQPSLQELTSMLHSIVDIAVKTDEWDSSIELLMKSLVDKTVSLCHETASKLKKSSEKFHYTFGMHEACTIIRHVLFWALGRETLDDLVALWSHECRRELMDKLISKEHWTILSSILQRLTSELNYTEGKDSLFSNLLANEDLCQQQYSGIPGGIVRARENMEKVLAKKRCNGPSLVLFDDAVEHVVKISRVLSLEKRSMMLVGVGGSGRKSLTAIASEIVDCKLCYPSKGHESSLAKILEDLRTVFRESGIKGQSIAFILSDTDIKDENFLDYINQQLVTGRIAGLFEKEETDTIVTDLRPAFKEIMPSEQDTPEQVLSFFWERVTQKLHFIFCFSPTGDQLLKWTKKFPGLLSGCTVNWFHPWPMQALESVSNKLLSLSDEDSPAGEMAPVDISALVSKIHFLMSDLSETYRKETGRIVHITPKSYLSFIKAVNDLFHKQYKVLKDSFNALCLGLEKMNSAKEQVDKMKDELKVKQANIAESQKQMSVLMGDIDKSTREATTERQKVKKIVSSVTKQAEEIYETKMEAEKDLEAARPALEAALEALNSITPKDMNALKALRKPPDVIKRIMDCVLLLRHLPISRTCWHEVKNIMVLEATYEESLKMMSDMGFLQTLLSFPKDEINDETVELLQPYFKSADFNYSSAKKASGNVAGLCNWAESMCKYHIVAREVEPKIIRLKESEKELNFAKREEERATADLNSVESALNSLQDKFQDAEQKMNNLKEDAEKTTTKMNNAITLIESLGSEETRWRILHKEKQVQMQYLLGDCLLACAFTSYLAPIGVSHRNTFMQRVKELCEQVGTESNPNFCPVDFLNESGWVLEWIEEGLPSDDFSIQNGTLFSFSHRVPYIIDPQGQALRWLQRKYQNAVCIPLSSSAFPKILENCISRGRPLIIQNVDSHFGSSLDEVLEPSPSGYVRLGDKEVEVAQGFRVILTTTLPNPTIYPEIFAKCTVINFTVSFNGLEDQFLGFLISRDESSLESRRQDLEEDVRKCKSKMQQLESELLSRLSSYEGDILEDSDLIGVLKDTKETTNRVSCRLEEASRTKTQISETCDMYKPCAKRATLLYFTLCDFSILNHMYNTSLQQFKVWLDEAIKSAPSSDDIRIRVESVTEELTRTIYEKVQFGIFEHDKDPFRFFMATRVCESDNRIEETALQLNSLLSMGKATATSRRKPKDWLSNAQWRNALHLQRSAPAIFGELVSSLQSNDAKWKAWLNSETPEKTPSPFAARRKLDDMSNMCMTRAFRPDRAGKMVSIFVENVLGEHFLSSRTADLHYVASTTAWNCPIICVISPGVDPTSKINEISRKMKSVCHNVSMGQGQEPIARECINIAKQRGEWVCIQNAHLAGAYLKELEEELYSLKHADPNFRLWITTEPSKSFPIGLLHMGLRITCEPPSGLRDGLTSLLSGLDTDIMDEVKMPQWKCLLVSLNIMHVLAQERKKFGPSGWNVPYEFSHADLVSSMNVIANHLQDLRGKKSASINWDTLHYLIGIIQYGGRIIDERDQKLMLSYCKRFISEEVLSGSVMLLNPKRFPKLAPTYRFHVSQDSTLEKLIEAAGQIPSYDIPQIFGLDMSAEVRSRVLKATSMFNSINLAANPPVVASNTSTDDTSLMETISSIMGKIQPIPADILNTSDNGSKLSAPLNTFFKIEIMFLNAAWERATRDLQRLQSIIEGSTTASADDVALLEKIKMKEASIAWSPEYWWRCDSLDSWVQSYTLCREHICSINQKCRGRCIWLPGLCNPNALLNAILQEEARSSREKGITIDTLQISYTITKYSDPKSIRDAPKEGIYIYGCVLEGASWDSQSSKLVHKEDSVPQNFPVIHVTAIPRASAISKRKVLWAPLYTAEKRTAKAFVDYIPLPIDGNELEWSQGGVALICNE